MTINKDKNLGIKGIPQDYDRYLDKNGLSLYCAFYGSKKLLGSIMQIEDFSNYCNGLLELLEVNNVESFLPRIINLNDGGFSYRYRYYVFVKVLIKNYIEHTSVNETYEAIKKLYEKSLTLLNDEVFKSKFKIIRNSRRIIDIQLSITGEKSGLVLTNSRSYPHLSEYRDCLERSSIEGALMYCLFEDFRNMCDDKYKTAFGRVIG